MQRFAGLDLARIKDHSALVVVEVSDDKIITVTDAIEYPHIPLDRLAEMVKAKYDERKWVVLLIDATGFGGAVAYDILKEHMNCKALTFTNRLKNEMVSNLIMLVTSRRLRIPKEYKRLVEQMLEQRMIAESSSIRYTHPSSKNDDLFWALCMACLACKDILSDIHIRVANKKFYQEENPYGKYHAIRFRW
jgi:phage FluMu gp28-like protein